MQLFQFLGAHQKNYSKSYVVIILRAAFEIQHKLRMYIDIIQKTTSTKTEIEGIY